MKNQRALIWAMHAPLFGFVLIGVLFIMEARSAGPALNVGGSAVATPELFDSGVNRDASALLAKYFSDASERLKKIVLNPPGTKASSREFHQAFAAQRLQQIDKIVQPLKATASGWAGTNLRKAFKDGIALAHKQAIDAGVVSADPKDRGLTSGSFTLIDVRTVQRFALDTVIDLHKAADSMGDRAKSVLRATAQEGLAESQINTILAGGVIEGKPVQTIKLLREALQAVHGDTVEINGRNFDVKYYAEMVARTKTRQATVQARHGRLEDLGLDLVAIVGKVSDSFCTAFLGQVFSLSGKSSKYPAYSSLPGGGPPFHPNCSKSTRPFVEELASDKQLDQAEILPASEKLLGMNPAEAQRSFQDLQIRSEIKDRYATTAAGVVAPAPAPVAAKAEDQSSPSRPPIRELQAPRDDRPSPPARVISITPAPTAAPEKPQTSGLSKAEAREAKRTEALRAKLAAAKAQTAELQQKLEELRGQVQEMKDQLVGLIAQSAGRSTEITLLQSRIASAEAVIRLYEANVKRLENRDQ